MNLAGLHENQKSNNDLGNINPKHNIREQAHQKRKVKKQMNKVRPIRNSATKFDTTITFAGLLSMTKKIAVY